MSIREDFELDLSSAEDSLDEFGRDVDQIGERFRSAIEEALGALQEVAIEDVDVTAVTDALEEALSALEEDVDVTAQVDADIEEALADLEEVESVAESVDGQTVEISVQASGTEDVSQELNKVETSANDSSTAVLAAGNALGGLGGKASGAVAGVAAFATAVAGASIGITSLFENSLEAVSAQQSFEARTGAAADELERLDSQALGFNTTLGELSLALGSSDEETRLAVARIAALGDAEGFTTERTDALIEGIVGIAKNAREVNPDLGSLGGNIDTLGTRLQRGGRFASAFGVSLDTDDIIQRAIENTGKLESELSLLERTEAAAQLATEQLGGDLGKLDASNVAVTFDSLKVAIEEALEPLGQPLISPVFEILRAAGPIIESVAVVLADIGEIALTSLAPIIDALEPIVQIISEDLHEGLQEIGPSVEELSVAFGDLIVAASPLIEELVTGFSDAAPVLTEVIDILTNLVEIATFVTEDLGKIPGALDAIAGSIPGLSTVLSFTDAIGSIGEVAQGTGSVLDEAFINIGDQLVRAEAATLGLSDASADAALEAANAASGHDDYALAIQILRTEVEEATEAEALMNEETDRASALAAVTAEQWTALTQAIADGSVSANDYQVIADGLGLSLEDVQTFANAASGAIERFASQALQSLPSVTEVISDIDQELQNQPDQIIQSLQESTTALADFQQNIAILMAFGFEDLAQLAITRGPEFTNELINAIRVGRPGLAQELENNLDIYNAQLSNAQAFITNQATPALVDASRIAAETASESFDIDLTTATQAEIDAATLEMVLAPETLGPAAGSLGAAATGAYDGALGLGSSTEGGLAEAQGFFDSVGVPGAELAASAEVAGSIIGNTFAIGIGNALTAAVGPSGFLHTQLEFFVDEMERIVREEAEANSPSLLFARIGEDLLSGLALPFDDLSSTTFGLDTLSVSPSIQSAGGSSQSFVIQAGAFQFTISGSGDPTAVADAVVSKINQALPLAASRAMLATEVMAG